LKIAFIDILDYIINSKLFLKIVLDKVKKKSTALATEFAVPSIFGKYESVPYLALCKNKHICTKSVITHYITVYKTGTDPGEKQPPPESSHHRLT